MWLLTHASLAPTLKCVYMEKMHTLLALQNSYENYYGRNKLSLARF